jgi:hypothetical protein
MKLCAISDSEYYFERVWLLIDYTYKPDNYTLLPGITDEEALGQYYLGNPNTALPDTKFKQCVDRYEYGKKLAELEKGVFTSLGYVTSKTGWETKYKARHIPEPLNLRGYLNEDLYGDYNDGEL